MSIFALKLYEIVIMNNVQISCNDVQDVNKMKLSMSHA